MSTNMFHEYNSQNSLSETSYTPQDFRLQFLSAIKFLICALILWKVFQMTFLKYRKRLTIEDRIQKKYRYCHGEFIDHYSEDENQLMYTTISNTIKNTDIKKKEHQGKGRRVAKKVSFNIEKNNYYLCEITKIDEDDDIEEKDSCPPQKEELPAKSIEKEEIKEVTVTVVVVTEKKDAGFAEMEVQPDESKITQETQASSLLENNNIKQSPKKDADPEVRPLLRTKRT